MPRNLAVSIWAISWTVLAFVEAIYRLGHRAVVTMSAGLEAKEWLALAIVTCTLGWVEGYRALHLRFVPSVVERAVDLAALRQRSIVLAPLHALSLVGAPKRTLLRAWSGVAAIVAAALLVRLLPSPWRGIVDGAVAVALAFGLASLIVRYVRAVQSACLRSSIPVLFTHPAP